MVRKVALDSLRPHYQTLVEAWDRGAGLQGQHIFALDLSQNPAIRRVYHELLRDPVTVRVALPVLQGYLASLL